MGDKMNFDVLDKLESKVQTAVDTISLLQMELEELKEENNQLLANNSELKGQQDVWQDRLRSLLGRMDEVQELEELEEEA
ncbi:MAG: cell division protein ZapB [Moritella dasanensis]|jgi:cell division protein ZapB|uniref:Cell division protein ZapB n=2 Tax=Moritellaceae TaxID=267891 RepID=A0A5J6WR48_MORMI|nr:cell division protein ZapB [Moritella sp. Urea-trap-13]QFI39375.1 cell division protein ZapB [Moritella marina ATCC 15381]